MASGPITSWEIDGETVETVTDFISGAPKSLQMVTTWNQKTLAPWKKSYDQPRQHIKKPRHYFANKGPSSQSYGFSSSRIWMWSWTIKKAKHWRIDAFELWCCRRLLRVPCTARKSNQSILKEINLNIHWKDWCWSWSSNTLSTWCKKSTHWKRPWCLVR